MDTTTEHSGAGPVVDTRGAADSCADLTNRAVDALVPGGSFVLVADHDPIALRYMLDAERPGAVDWEPVENGPRTWQVRVVRTAT